MSSNAASISLNESSVSLVVGESTTLKISGVKSSKVKWTTSSKSIATVNNGKITAKKSGTATITATYNGIKFKCKVTVVTKVKNVTLYNDKKFKIILTGLKSNGLNLQVKNKTDNDYNISVEYLVCDDDYYNGGIFCNEMLPNNFLRTIFLETYSDTLNKSAKNISARFGIWDADTGNIEKYITVKKIKIR
jgi:hypothetical protein